MHNYIQKGNVRDLVNNNLHKGNCTVYAPSAERWSKKRNLVHKNIHTYTQI